MSEWLPIENAPKDGTEIRVRWRHAGKFVIRRAVFDARCFMLAFYEVKSPQGKKPIVLGRGIPRAAEWQPAYSPLEMERT